MNITELKPGIVWKFFHEVTQVPRPSKREGKMIRYLEDFANSRPGVSLKKDRAGNILMSKPATRGKENLPTVILQSHIDMVCEKNSDKVFDFDNDAIETVVDGNWLRANGTTLGADNGIGVAAQLAILASDDIEHGALECLFTTDEETGLTGANALQEGFMTGRILLNLDSEDEGELFIGCAGGKRTTAVFTYRPTASLPDHLYLRISVTGLNGGHSGGEIHKGLGNANKLLARFLYLLTENKYSFVLNEIDGGNLHNVIPREAHAVIGIQSHNKENVSALLNLFTADVENELKHTDAGVRIYLESVDRPKSGDIDGDTTYRLINSLHGCPHGVVAMSHDIEGLVETSTNLASVKMQEGNTIQVVTSQRSSIESGKTDIAHTIAAIFRLAGAEVTHSEGYPGWSPNPDSAILKAARESYLHLFRKEPKIMSIHAGLECGLFLEKYPHLDMISFGPTLRDVHSPNERIQIDTVALWWTHLLDLLKNIPAK
ncbi:Cytosol non-specific dipeptidase [Bacteroidales bacterium Barb7]|nr:Cytosol non-specific dipeptidase [Bacteroidales bacterium Barb7]